MVRDAIKYMLFGIGRLWSYVMPYRLADYLQSCKVYVFTGYHARYFKAIEKNVLIASHTEVKGHKCIALGEGTVIGDYGFLSAWPYYKNNKQEKEPELIIGKKLQYRCAFTYHVRKQNRDRQ